MTIGGYAAAAGLTKIDITCQFADDQNVESRNEFRLEAGRTDQLLVANGRAEVGKQAHVFAQAQNGLFGAQRTVEFVVFPIAHSAKQHGV